MIWVLIAKMIILPCGYFKSLLNCANMAYINHIQLFTFELKLNTIKFSFSVTRVTFHVLSSTT